MKKINHKVEHSELTNEIVENEMEFKDLIFEEKFSLICIDEFTEKIVFHNCIFEKEMLIYSCDFRKDLIFQNCIFQNKQKSFQLSVLTVFGDLIIQNCNFLSEIEIIDSTFKGKTVIKKSSFSGGINLFSGKTESFGNISFEGGLNIFRQNQHWL